MMKTSISIMLSIMMFFSIFTNNVIAEENEDNSSQEVTTEYIEVENEDENEESGEIIIEEVEQEQNETNDQLVINNHVKNDIENEINDLESNNVVAEEGSTNVEDQLLTQPKNNDEITVSSEDELKDALAANKKVIYIDGAIYTGSLEIPEGNSVTIKSVDGGPGDITSDGNGAFLLNVNKGATLTLEGSLTLSGNDKVPVLVVEGECTIKDGVVISDGYSSNSNSTQLKGGGITLDGGTLHLEGGTIENNIYAVKYTTGHGGAGIYAKNGSTLYMNNGSIINNLAGTEGNDTFGGGICLDSSKAIISGGIIANNVAYNRGGGINVSTDSTLEINGNVEIKNNIVRGNTSAYYKSGGGGGIYNEGKLIMTAGIISGNEAYRGGGICNAGASGGLYPPGSSVEDEDKIAILSNVQITNNKAFYGAGIFNSTYVELSNNMIKGNTLTKNVSATSIAPNTYPTDGEAYGGGIYNGQYKSSSSRDKGQYGILNLKDGNTISDNNLEGPSELGHGKQCHLVKVLGNRRKRIIL